jgi:dTDP-4-dehydrorhamnose 3,5-epimerase
MKFEPSVIPEVVVIEPHVFGDDRGFFMETYEVRVFAAAGLEEVFVQDNHSGSRKGTLRGLHYQLQRPQGKLLRVVAGEIYDVAVDLRRNSPTFGKWMGLNLSAQNRLLLWIPKGFAHGFYVLSEWAEVTYKVTDFYAPQSERTLLWNDPEIGIRWPLEGSHALLLSGKDAEGLPLNQAETYD